MCEGWRIATLFWLESFLDILPPDTHLTIIPPEIWRMESLNPKINNRIVLLSPFHMRKGRNSNSNVNSHSLPVFWSSTFSWALGCCGNRELGNCLVGKYCMCLFFSQILPSQQWRAHACQWWGLKSTESRITVQRSSVRQTGQGRCTYINGPLWAIFCFSVHKMLCDLHINVQALQSGTYKWLLVKSLRIKAIFPLSFELCSLLFKFERFHTSCDDDECEYTMPLLKRSWLRKVFIPTLTLLWGLGGKEWKGSSFIQDFENILGTQLKILY